MEKKKNAPNMTFVAIFAFIVTLTLCLVELDLLSTPVDALLQRGSAVLGVLSKPVWAIWKWLA